MNPTKNTTDKLFLMRRIIGLELCLLRTQKKMSLSEAANKSGLKHICHTSNDAANFYEISRLQLSEKLYQTALKHYNQKEYQQALTAFTKLEAEGFNGADIHNDKAITYYNIGEYEKCIQECREVLKSGETEAYPAANFNAGKAYEKLNNKEKALQNYQLAYKRSPDKDIYKKNLERLQKSMPLQKSQRTKANIRE